ncbi:kinase-like domain, phloem protein 2-like protein [Tanacetum coccineum]
MSSIDDFAHLKISLKDILFATYNFSEKNHISSSRIAKTYKGQIRRWSHKRIKIDAERYYTKEEEMFWMQLFTLSSLKHQNLRSLVGFCDEDDEKIIIYRHETTRGMLNQYLSDPLLLTWVQRLKICVGLAKALSYIHYDETRDFSVIHRMINSFAVQLDTDWEPKLYHFGHSMKIKASQRHHSFHTNLKYVDGESIIKDDEDEEYLDRLAITHYRKKELDKIIDSKLWKQMDLHSFNMFAEIAYECLDEERSRRPNIDVIAPRLEKALELARENMPIV